MIMNSDQIYTDDWWSNQTNFSEKEDGTHTDNQVIRLVVYTILSLVGTMLNVFQISALIIQNDLHHSRNALIANLAISHMMITLVAFPTLCIGILAGTGHSLQVCRWSWYCTLLTFLSAVLSYLVVAVGSFVDVYRCRGPIKKFSSGKKYVMFNIVCIWLASSGCLAFLVIQNQLDICQQNYISDNLFFLILIPILLSLILFIKSLHHSKVQRNGSLEDSCHSSEKHRYKLLKSHAIAFVFFLIQWSPLIFILNLSVSDDVRDATLSHTLILAQTHSCLWSLCYAFSHSSFRRAFAQNIRYFCFKSRSECSKTLQEKPYGSVRVHIGMETRVGERSQKFDHVLSAIMPNENQQAKLSELDFL